MVYQDKVDAGLTRYR